MKNVSVILPALGLFTFFIASCSAENPSKTDGEKTAGTEQVSRNDNPENSYAGTYSFGTDAEKGPTGTVHIYPVTRNSAIFYLEVNRGAPSYNSGRLLGEIVIEDGKATYTSSDAGCVLNFNFSGDELTVAADEKKDQCGFGHAVYPDHTYKRSNGNIPQYYLSGEGDTVYFESLITN